MGVATVWIYCFHIVPSGLLQNYRYVSTVWDFIHTRGFCGVDIFLLLSSFGLFYSFQRNPVASLTDYWEFLKRRFSRVLCVLFPVSLLVGLVDHWTVFEFLTKITGFHQLFTNIYSYLWFIPCIFLFYIFAPLYYSLFITRQHKSLFSLCAIAATLVLIYWLKPYARMDLYGILSRISVFLLGFYFGYASQTKHGRGHQRFLLILSVVILLIGCAYSYLLSVKRATWYLPTQNAQANILIAPPLVILLSAFASLCQRIHDCPFRRILRQIYRFLYYLGTISLEVYVWHEWIWLKMNNSGTLISLFGSSMLTKQLATLALTLVFAIGTHYISRLVHLRLQITPYSDIQLKT